MIIENFCGFYGVHEFSFSEGLTIINAKNGNGKTTLFRAITWLFNQHHGHWVFSRKKVSELALNESAKTRVKLYLFHQGEKAFERSVTIKKESNNTISQNEELFGYKFIEGQEIKVPHQALFDYFTISYIADSNIKEMNLRIFLEHFKKEYGQFSQEIDQLANNYLDLMKRRGLLKFTIKFQNDYKNMFVLNKEDGSVMPIDYLNTANNIIIWFAMRLAIRDWYENVTNEQFPLFFDAPFAVFHPDEINSIMEVLNGTNKQIVIATQAFLDITRHPKIEQLKKLGCTAYYLDRVDDPVDIASISLQEEKVC